MLKIKILEENDARKQNNSPGGTSNALMATMKNKQFTSNYNQERTTGEHRNDNKGNFKNKPNSNIVCFRCNKKGHIAPKCYSKIVPKKGKSAGGTNDSASVVKEVKEV